MTDPSTEHPVEKAFREFAVENKCEVFSMSRKDHLEPPASGKDPESPPHLWVDGEYAHEGRAFLFHAALPIGVDDGVGQVFISAQAFMGLRRITSLEALCSLLEKADSYGVDLSDLSEEGVPSKPELLALKTELTDVNFTSLTVHETSIRLDDTLNAMEEWLGEADAEPPPRF